MGFISYSSGTNSIQDSCGNIFGTWPNGNNYQVFKFRGINCALNC